RVSTVNPDAVIQGSAIWSSDWKAERANTYGVGEEELQAFYRGRTKLGVAVLPEDVAEAIAFFAGPRSAKSTGNVVNVDGGVTAGAPAGPGAGQEGDRGPFRCELPPALHQPGRYRDDRAESGQAVGQADALQGSVRDPVGRVDGHEPERMDQVHEAPAEEAEVKGNEARQDLLRQRQPGPVTAGEGEHAAGMPAPEGDRGAGD